MAETAESKEVYLPIPLDSLRVDSVTDFDLYIQPDYTLPPVLYRQRELPFTEEVRRRLIDSRVKRLFIPSSQENQYNKYIEANLATILSSQEIPAPQRTELFYNSAQRMVHDFFDDPTGSDTLTRSESLVDSVLSFLFKEPESLRYFLKVASFDYYTYTHSVNVFVYSVLLARHAGFEENGILNDFGAAALLHDIGKSRIDTKILYYQGALNEAQWELIRHHPEWGCEILRELGVTNTLILDVTMHHHEKLSGLGYPDKLRNHQIQPLVRITTICDIFDALTTRRPYKEPLTSFDALQLMREDMAEDLDQEYFRKFIDVMALSAASDPRIQR